MYGKITIIKSLLLSQLTYHCSIVPQLDSKVIKKIDKMLFDFLWDKKPHRIKKCTIIGDYYSGGLKMPSFYEKCIALKVTWVKRLFSTEIGNEISWRQIVFNDSIRSNKIFWEANISIHDAHVILKDTCNTFWKDVVYAWCNYNHFCPVTLSEIRNQLLWYNSSIKVNNMMVFYKNMYDVGIVKITDILKDNGTF